MLDGAGNLYVDDATNNRVQEVALATGTQWGESMTADDIYTVAGNSSGTSGNSGNGGAATSAKLDDSEGMGIDPHGDLILADHGNNVIREVALSCRERSSPPTANDIYAIVGNGTSGSTGVGGQAGVAELDGPEASITDAAGDVYIATDANCVDEIPATSSTQWGQSMTAGDLYTVAGTCGSSGHTGDGAAATSATLTAPGPGLGRKR